MRGMMMMMMMMMMVVVVMMMMMMVRSKISIDSMGGCMAQAGALDTLDRMVGPRNDGWETRRSGN